METKTLLRLIRDDISHLEGITGEFRMESLPTAEEVELALVRANALLRQLELLHKSLNKEKESLPLPRLIGQLNEEIQVNISPKISNEAIPIEPSDLIKPVTTSEDVINVILEPVVIQESASPEKETFADNIILKEEKHEDTSDPELNKPVETAVESQQMVNDLLSREKSDSGYQIIPINSMWDGIGINDRFLFVRELFENDSSKFEKAVTALNEMPTIQEAVNYLKLNFKWHKTEASQKFLVLVKRRFTT